MLTFVTGQIHWGGGDPGNYADGIITRDTGPGACKPGQLLHPPNASGLFSLHLSFVIWGLKETAMWSSVWIQ